MTFTYDPSTDIGRVRRTIPDKLQAEALLTDEEIASYLADEGDWRRASAAALEAIATDEALVLKVVRVGNLSTDGAKLANTLLERAQALRGQAADAEAVSDGGGFEIAEMVVDPFSYRERAHNEALRHG